MNTTDETVERIVNGIMSQDSDTRNEALSELAALAEIKQRVADLEAFYQHMTSADLQNNHLEYLFNEMMEAGLRDPFEPHDETTAWAEFSALLDSLKVDHD